MDSIYIKGGIPLKGKIHISGSKNAALPLMATSLLTKDEVTLRNIPNLSDICSMANILVQHGVQYQMDGSEISEASSEHTVKLKAENITNFTAPYELVRKMRASVLVLGALLARFGEAKVSLPGGCAIGSRPIDMHIKALEAMGANIELTDGYIIAKVDGRLKGALIEFDKKSVGATENILMAATLAEGTTTILNAAKEPEVNDLANCLQSMGAKIEGIGTDKLVITGVDELHGTDYTVIPDRIELGTYLIAAAVTDGELELINGNLDSIESLANKLNEAGVSITETENGLLVKRSNKVIHEIDIITGSYPEFPTDMQAQMMVLLTLAEGASLVTETIFENRFMHVPELIRMGARITTHGNSAMIRGVSELTGAEVMATDLRASVSLVLAGLAAKGETVINRVYHIDRGYARIEEKLSACGAIIKRVKSSG